MKAWLRDLKDEYPTNRSSDAIVRLARVFANIPENVMRQAVDEYLLKEKFFPRVSDLRPYVQNATEAARGPVRYNQIADQPRRVPTDNELLLYELQQGTIPLTDLVEPNYDCDDETGRVIPATITTTQQWIDADPERQAAIAAGRAKIASLYNRRPLAP